MKIETRYISGRQADTKTVLFGKTMELPVCLYGEEGIVIIPPYEDRKKIETELEKAAAGKLRGWSFGFYCLKDDYEERRENEEVDHRNVRELILNEVSILDDRKTPAYAGTSIEVRDDDMLEFRAFEDETELIQEEKENDIHEFEHRYMKITAEQPV